MEEGGEISDEMIRGLLLSALQLHQERISSPKSTYHLWDHHASYLAPNRATTAAVILQAPPPCFEHFPPLEILRRGDRWAAVLLLGNGKGAGRGTREGGGQRVGESRKNELHRNPAVLCCPESEEKKGAGAGPRAPSNSKHFSYTQSPARSERREAGRRGGRGGERRRTKAGGGGAEKGDTEDEGEEEEEEEGLE